MKMRLSILSIFALFVLAIPCWGANQKVSKDDAKSVPLFEAVDQGLVSVRLTPKNSLQSTVSVTNKSSEPLMVEMPVAFAGVPVLAQFDGRGGMFGGGGMGGMGGGGGGLGGLAGLAGMAAGMGGGGMGGGGRGGVLGGAGGGNQSVGGGMGGGGGRGGMGGGGMGGGGMGGGGWFIPPEKTVREKVRTVCLEYGKKEPRQAIQYTMIPIESYTDNKTTQQLCAMLGDESVEQMAVQAAVWNTENNIPFEELATKEVRTTSREEPYRSLFTPEQVEMGYQIFQYVEGMVNQTADEQATLSTESQQ